MPSVDLVIVAQTDDAVAEGVHDAASAAGAAVAWVQPSALASVGVEVRTSGFKVDGNAVGAVLWRVSPEMPLAADFQADDRTFASAEVAAAWIAGLRAPGVRAINRFDAEAWYSGLRPHYWRRRLRRAGVALTNMQVCATPVPPGSDGAWRWSPYTTGEPCELPESMARAVMAAACHLATPLATAISVGGRIVTGPVKSNVTRASELLDRWGVGLAAIDADADGRVYRVRVLPVIDDRADRQRVVAALESHLYDDCLARRS